MAEIDPFEHDVFLQTVSHIGVRFEAWEKIARPADKKRKREGDDSNSQGHKRPNNNTTGKSKYDTPVAVSDRDGDAKMGAVVPVKHRMEQERTFLNMEVARQCKNCGGNDHRTKECIAVCGGCGHPNHVQSDCPQKLENCTCVMHPAHLAEECKLLCTQACPENTRLKHDAAYKGGNVTPNQMHSLVKCSRCAVCGSQHECANNGIRQGEYFCSYYKGIGNGIRCLGCGSQSHFSFQCPNGNVGGEWIALLRECSALNCGRYFCRKHCYTCLLDPKEGMDAHRRTAPGQICPSIITTEPVLGTEGKTQYWVQCGREKHEKTKRRFGICPT